MITVLRLGHRQKRDERISTHVGLVSRALGADEVIYSGEEDRSLTESVKDVTKRWGGKFSARYEPSWKKVLNACRKKKFCTVHLTMYGLPVKKKIAKKKNNSHSGKRKGARRSIQARRLQHIRDQPATQRDCGAGSISSRAAERKR